MGNAASITVSGGVVTVSGLTNITEASGGSPPVGGSLTIYGAATSANNGSFPVATWVSTTSITITNALASTDANNGSIGWSLNWDNSAYIGPIDLNISSATDLSTPDQAHGSYDYSSSNPASRNLTDNDRPSSFFLFTPGLPTPSGGSTVKYYKMVGYYTTGTVYESFVTTGSPASPTTVNPNTGHTLVNTFVSSFWEV
jgi:hypothetical protein